MSLRQQIEQHIQAYLDGEISVSSFEQWFIPATWHIDPEHDAELGPLVAYVTSILASYKDAETDEARFREQLSQAGSRTSQSECSDQPGSSVMPRALNTTERDLIIRDIVASEALEGNHVSYDGAKRALDRALSRPIVDIF